MADLPRNWLDPLPLSGGRQLPCRIVPGPMEGITVGPFCRILSRRKLARCWFTPFVRLTTGVPRLARLRVRLQPYLDTGLPVVAQLMGLDSDLLAGAARRVAELGVLGVDLNCACPSPTVVGNGAGGSLLRRPSWIGETIRRIRAACPGLPVSVKLRTGFASVEEMPEILAAVREARPDFVVLHYRTVAEQYRRVAGGWERLARAKREMGGVPLLGSGDLFTVEDALRLWRETRVDGVALARGLLRNPCLLRDTERACRGETALEDRSALLAFLADLVAEEGHARSRYHGFVLDCAAQALGRDDPLFQRLVACRDLGECGDLLGTLRNGHTPDR